MFATLGRAIVCPPVVLFIPLIRIRDHPGKAPAVNDPTILLLLTPLVVIQVGLIIVALRDLLRPERKVKGDSKLMWGIIIVVVGMIGPILYLLVGREEG